MKKKKDELRVLFVCKNRSAYGISFGLINSCLFICNALRSVGIECKVVQVEDNNKIDHVVHEYKPSHVFVEALWVVPQKFDVLCSKYKKVEWFVRVHSKIPFLAHEGMAIDWFKGYYEVSKRHNNFQIASNNEDVIVSLDRAFDIPVGHWPNIYYPPDYCNTTPVTQRGPKYIDIGCFGAIRPMKNQLYQALAAISFGNEIHKQVRFHINANRVEQKGDPILKNIEHAFEGTKHTLIRHEWMNHLEFIRVVKQMELGMQVSFSESFDIVAADFVWNGIPIVGSPDIDWLSFLYKANPNSIDSIINKLHVAYYGQAVNLQHLNKLNLDLYNQHSLRLWLENLGVI
jgi:hypothetical protein